MSIIAENSGNTFKRITPGSYAARCYSMIEMGTITEQYLGEPKTMKKVSITWELPTELEVFKEEKGQEPFVISKTYTLSMFDKANLRKDLESWRGKGFTEEEAKSFDITKLIGKECMLSIIDKPSKDGSKSYPVIASISRLPKGMECPAQINPSKVLSFDNFDESLFNSLPDFLKDKIKSSLEYRHMINPEMTDTNLHTENTDILNPPNDLPF